MADDIVTRLRQCCYPNYDIEDECELIAAEAADEIERLRAENERLRAAGDALIATLVAVSVAGLPEDMDAFGTAVNDWQEARRG